MKLEQVLHMIGGDGETNYASNSALQKTVISKAKPIVEKAILDLYCITFPKSLSIADLGCSSGPNTLMVISEIIDAVDRRCHHLNRPSPEFQVYLNDLPTNDFNAIFRSLPGFHEKLKKEKGRDFGPCYIVGVPGSFYGRLFPDKSLHFVHSSYSVHWLSQVPSILESENYIGLNKGHIYIAETSPPLVHKVYLEQFQKDFTLFLRSRSQELVPSGRMVLALVGRIDSNPISRWCGYIFELLAQALNDMVSQGIVEEAKADSFNMPVYLPSIQELRGVIEKEGSFHVDQLEIIELNWDQNHDDDNPNCVPDVMTSGNSIAKRIRAISESMLINHFGTAIIEDLFERFAAKIAGHLSKEKSKVSNLVISMIKKDEDRLVASF
ncbi:probable jasmonic acid carboxyl methyltransferase 2 [Magnolia sinica]|uniref:probable jasmonic acid carboxyl methyltransferase 2 n=1 Tax=Magnolia sinica TaxID=86752 RepID=UPI00265A7B2B|nr:probable jasmonic acid carboxyl methyltransferase 2 [Magnolia sinica]